MARILVTEELAERGLDALRGRRPRGRRAARACRPTSCSTRSPAPPRSIIRSATKVTRRGARGGRPTSSSWAGPASGSTTSTWPRPPAGASWWSTRRSRTSSSAAEHTMALLLAQARNVPQAHAALKAGRWERSKWEGVELHGKTLGIVGLGRIGTLVAQRALRLRHAPRRLRPVRGRPSGPGRWASSCSTLDELVRRGRLHHHPPAEDARDARA